MVCLEWRAEGSVSLISSKILRGRGLELLGLSRVQPKLQQRAFPEMVPSKGLGLLLADYCDSGSGSNSRRTGLG